MEKWLRRIRAATGMGLTWAAAWFGAGMILLLVVGLGAADVPFPLFFALLGFLAGVTFSGLLGIAEGGRRFDQMSLPRFAAWGAVGGLLLSGAFAAVAGPGGGFLVLGPVFALAGAGCAAGSLALARMAKDRDLLDATGDVGAAAAGPVSACGTNGPESMRPGVRQGTRLQSVAHVPQRHARFSRAAPALQLRAGLPPHH